MKFLKSPIALASTILALVLVSGCATNPNGTATGTNAGDQAALGAGIGAVAGFAACKAFGGSGSSCAKAAVATGAVGGFIGWRNGKQKDLAEAQTFENAIRGYHVPVVTDITSVGRTNDSGRSETLNAWKGTTVGLPPTLLAQRSPDVQRSVELAGKLATSRSEPSRVLVSVPDNDKITVEGWLRNGLNQGTAGGARPEIRMLKAPEGSVPFVRVEPANQTQFGQSGTAAKLG